ncbi:hypothetical protein IFM89_012971 [Coptis chinensis]|uniref:PSMD12/CSN4-like N-terminal domain-containing protein n=1 Tax=Coptis chinensis TaxID=261450 RepID=A0A835HQB1_9MAGN|nr:hypothetical protein IFM89_012971 [Coptis chinensis]
MCGDLTEWQERHATLVLFDCQARVLFSLKSTFQTFDSMEGGDNLDAQIESLLNVEKQSRLAENVSATKKAVIDIIQLCYGARAWKTLNEQILILSKRRGQLKQYIRYGPKKLCNI